VNFIKPQSFSYIFLLFFHYTSKAFLLLFLNFFSLFLFLFFVFSSFTLSLFLCGKNSENFLSYFIFNFVASSSFTFTFFQSFLLPQFTFLSLVVLRVLFIFLLLWLLLSSRLCCTYIKDNSVVI